MKKTTLLTSAIAAMTSVILSAASMNCMAYDVKTAYEDYLDKVSEYVEFEDYGLLVTDGYYSEDSIKYYKIIPGGQTVDNGDGTTQQKDKVSFHICKPGIEKYNVIDISIDSEKYTKEDLEAAVYQVYKKDEINFSKAFKYQLYDTLPVKDSITKALRLKALLEEKGMLEKSDKIDDIHSDFCLLLDVHSYNEKENEIDLQKLYIDKEYNEENEKEIKAFLDARNVGYSLGSYTYRNKEVFSISFDDKKHSVQDQFDLMNEMKNELGYHPEFIISNYTSGVATYGGIEGITVDLTHSKFGDVDGDSELTAMDASYVLMHYSDVQTGVEIDTNTSDYGNMTIFGDYNGDGTVDALDASEILTVYAENQTK